jgi:sugar lactone lactonase YvrE
VRRRLSLPVALATLALPSAAHAVPDCAHPPAARTLVSGQGVLESAIVDRRGRLIYTDTSKKALMVLARPGGTPRVLTPGVDSGGGLAFVARDRLLVGYGDAVANGANGGAGKAGLYVVDLNTGRNRLYVKGLQMANGVTRAKDGTVYATNDVTGGVDRVTPKRRVQLNWSAVPSANGLAFDPTGRWLFVNETFRPPAIARVDTRHPDRIVTWAQGGPGDALAGLDGMAADARGRLFVAANGGGQIWRVAKDRKPCALTRGLILPSAVALGRGRTGFRAGNLYAVTFHGDVVELPGGAR